ncbi:MAG: electron transfer flavoprotein subunit beta/FixA family protein [Oscillospiraceae bacterium]
MNIIVCIKQVPDTNEVKLDPIKGTLIRDGVPSIINPDDKAGLEAALAIKDKVGGKVTIISMGPPQADLAIREALAMGADEGILVSDRAFGGADTWATSSTLASAIRKVGDYDLIMTGRQAIDGDTAQVGPQIAEHLHIPNISYAEGIEIDGEYVTVRRQYEDRHHMLRVKLPCLITALSELNTPRYMTPGGIVDAYKKEVKLFARKDLDVEDENIGLAGSCTKVFKSFTKPLKGKGTVVNLDPEESVDFLVEKLKEKHIL